MEEARQKEEGAQQVIDTGLSCLVIATRLHQVAADPNQLIHQFGQSGQVFSELDILLAAKWLKLKARAIDGN